MKSIFKKIAFVLALAMVVTAFPVKTAAAATTPSVKDKRVLYIGSDANEQYTDCGWITVYNKTGYTMTFESSDPEVVTVSKRGWLTAVNAGTATVTVTFSKEGAKAITGDCTVTVKKNAEVVTLDEESAKAISEMTVGDEVELKAVLTDADGSEEGITDKARFKSSDTKVVDVDYKTGKVTAVAEGTAKILVYGVQWDYNKETKKYEVTRTTEPTEYEVVVKAAVPTITDAKLVSTSKIELTVENVAAEDLASFKIISANGGDIKSIFKDPVLKDNTLTIEKYIAFANGEKVSFAFGDGEAFEYTVAYGEPDHIVITGPAQVTVGVATDIEYKVVDANGIDVTGSIVPTFSTDNAVYSVISGKQITICQVGEVAKITAKYATGKFHADWTQVEITSNEVAIAAVEAAPATVAKTEFSIDNANFGTADVSMYLSDDKTLYGKITKSDKSTITGGFEFDSLTPTIMVVGKNTGKLAPVTTGTAKILITEPTTKAQFVATIVVKADAKLTNAKLEPVVTVISNADVAENALVNVQGYDQYGNKVSVASLDVEALTWPQGVADANAAKSALDVQTATSVGMTGLGKTAGTYTYRLTAKDGANATIGTFITQITVKEPTDDVASYKVLVKDAKTNLVIEPKDAVTSSGIVEFTVVGLDKNGVAKTVVTNAAIKVGNEDVEPDPLTGKYTYNFMPQASAPTAGAIIISDTGYDVKTGATTITGTVEGRTVVPATVTVSLPKTAPAFTIESTKIAADDEAAVKAQIKFADDVVKYQNDFTVEVVTTTGTNYVVAKKMVVYVKVESNYVKHEIELNRVFTVVAP